MNKRLKILPLTANTGMAQEIAEILDVEVMPAKVPHFADGEVCFEAMESCRGDDVYIIQSTCTPVNERLMETLVTIDALKRASARSITCVMPYYGYARQDRKAKPRQPISAKLVADLLTTAGANRVVCTDLHVSQIQGFFNIPVDDISPMPLYWKYFMDLGLDNICCVSPDHGGVVRTTRLAEKFNAPLAIIDKRRPKPNQAEFVGIVGDVKDKNCIIVDDIVDTAGTLCLAASKLKELGAKKIYAAITHGILSGKALENINNSCLEKLVITDTIPLPEEKKSDKIEVLHLAPLFATVISALEEGESLSEARQKFDKKIFRSYSSNK